MSALAKIILRPRGDYSSSESYLSLDIVRYDNKIWICKKDCKNITPTEGEYWTYILNNVSDETIDIINYDDLDAITNISDDDVIPIKNSIGYKKTLWGTLKTKFWTYVQSQLATVATSGDYIDLNGAPTFLLDEDTLIINI